jgi:glycosyltransferase involved in cell wall biosynthesis
MNIVMDFRKYDGVVGGVEQVVTQVISQIAPKGHTFILLSKQNRHDEVKVLFQDIPHIKHIPLPVETHAISMKNAWHDSNTIQDIAESENAPVIHFPYNWSFPYKKKAKTILTIHDVIPFTFREAMGWFRNKFIYKPAIRRACKLNDVITTISEFSKQDIVAKTGADPNRIRVIPNGFRNPYPIQESITEELISRYNLQESFVLNVGGIHERKNIPRLIGAFALFAKQTQFPGKLLITGKASGAPYQDQMRVLCDQAVAETGLQERVVFTGFVSDEELDHLLKMAAFLVYPSLYEGFGIPLLEAFNVGTPVVTANTTATREIGEAAAVLIDPTSVEDMAGGMSKLFQDKELGENLSEKGRERAQLYTWDKLGQQYLDLYQELAQ